MKGYHYRDEICIKKREMKKHNFIVFTYLQSKSGVFEVYSAGGL